MSQDLCDLTAGLSLTSPIELVPDQVATPKRSKRRNKKKRSYQVDANDPANAGNTETDGNVGPLVAVLKETTPKPNQGNYRQATKSEGKTPNKFVRKTQANFKCTSEDCGKAWSSVHAWASRQVKCDFCDSNAKVQHFQDEQCELDYYGCSSCRNSWQSIHDGTLAQVCDCCQFVVTKESTTQLRYSRHYWYKCLNTKECGAEWEDFCQGNIYSQRCRVCHSAGIMIGTSRAPVRSHVRRGQFGMGSGHDVEGCDMCQELQRQGMARTCRKKALVVFEVKEQPDGSFYEEIVVALDKN